MIQAMPPVTRLTYAFTYVHRFVLRGQSTTCPYEIYARAYTEFWTAPWLWHSYMCYLKSVLAKENVHTGCKSCVVECSIRSQWPLDSDCGINQSSTILDSKSTTQMCLTKFESMADAGTPVASFSKEVYWRLAKRPLFFNGRFSLSPVKFLRKRGHRVIPHTWLATVNRLLMLTTGPHDSHIKS